MGVTGLAVACPPPPLPQPRRSHGTGHEPPGPRHRDPFIAPGPASAGGGKANAPFPLPRPHDAGGLLWRRVAVSQTPQAIAVRVQVLQPPLPPPSRFADASPAESSRHEGHALRTARRQRLRTVFCRSGLRWCPLLLPLRLSPRGSAQGCIRREGASEAAPAAVRQAAGGGCRSGWGRLLSVTDATEAGTWRQGDSGWA